MSMIAEQYCIKNKIKHEAIQLKNPVKSISINAKDIVYTPSKNQVQLSAAVAPAGANAKVAWSVETPSNDYGFAKITKDGKLTVKLKKKLKKKTKITVTVSKSGYKTRKRTFRIK